MGEALKITLGDWRADKGSHNWYVNVAGRGDVCMVLVCAEDEANAHAIAALPKLLSALEKANRLAYENGPSAEDALQLIHHVTRAALAKARGEA